MTSDVKDNHALLDESENGGREPRNPVLQLSTCRPAKQQASRSTSFLPVQIQGLLITLLAVLVLQGCNALNPLCDSARPAPVLSSLSVTTITFAEVQQGFLLTLNGREFVASSVAVINGTTLSTQVLSSKQLSVTITTTLISAPGSASITVSTPSGNSGNLGCTSGGTSKALTLTIT